jgi:hypothetical protein
MGLPHPVVQAFVRALLDAGHDVAPCRATGSQPVGDHDVRRVPLTIHKLSCKAFGGLGIAAALHQNVENETVPIDGAPKPVFLAVNGDNDLIEVPFVTKPAGGSPPDIMGKMQTELSTRTRTVWCEMMVPHAASRSSTMRRLSGKRR